MSSTENNYVNTDLGNVALNSCGEYNADSSYEYLDTVNYEGGSYFCKVEFPKKISGIAPKAGVSTEFWQLLTIPGDATSEYIKLHDEVVNKAKQVETSRAAVELSQTEVEAAQTDVSQMRQDTQEAAEEAASSRDSAAGYAQSAEASRTAAKESEDNINAQVTGFDVHAAEKTSETESAITEARRVAVNAVSTKQDDATQAVIDEGDKQIKNVEDAGTEQVGKAKSAGESAVSAAGAAGVSAVNAVKAQQTASIKAIQEAGKNALQNISNGVDKGLSEEGKAADAKATGEAISKLTEDLGNIGKVIEVGGEKTITTPQLADISTIKVGRPTFKYHQTKYNDELSSEEYYRTLDAIEFTDESIKTLRLNFKPASIICFRAQDGMAEGVVPIANVTDNGDNSFSFATTTANKAKWIRISWSNTRYPNLVPLVTNEDEWDANADKTFIGSKIIKLPTSLKDKVVNISNLGDDVLKLFNPEIINPCDYKGDEIRIFGKGLCIGDSLTYGQSDRNDTGSLYGFKHAGMNYPDNLMRLTGIDLTNAGTAGKTFQTWWELHKNDDFSGHDFCIIALGVNDAYFNKMWTDDSLTYLTNIVNAVRTANNHIPIFITTPPMYFLGYTGADFESVAEGIRNAATSLNLYLVDFRKYLTEFSRVNAEKVSVMAYGHFNAYGYYKIAVAYKSYISYIISQNMDDFRNVQFVGTNYSYSSN